MRPWGSQSEVTRCRETDSLRSWSTRMQAVWGHEVPECRWSEIMSFPDKKNLSSWGSFTQAVRGQVVPTVRLSDLIMFLHALLWSHAVLRHIHSESLGFLHTSSLMSRTYCTQSRHIKDTQASRHAQSEVMKLLNTHRLWRVLPTKTGDKIWSVGIWIVTYFLLGAKKPRCTPRGHLKYCSFYDACNGQEMEIL
jgi:hypothetical protein